MKKIMNEELNINRLNEEVELYGWVSKKRNLGGQGARLANIYFTLPGGLLSASHLRRFPLRQNDCKK